MRRGQVVEDPGDKPVSMDELTWRCEACGEIRPDAKISVHKTDIGEACGIEKGLAYRNVNYCNDRSRCLAEAIAIGDKSAQRIAKGRG